MKAYPVISLLVIFTMAFSFSKCKKDTHFVVNQLMPLENDVLNDSIWRVDSVRIWELWEKYWFYDDNYRHDSAIAVCQNIIDLGKPMMEYRFDSTIYEKYAKAYGGIGYNLLGKGRLDEGLKLTQESFDLITAKFGEFHVRNTELCTGFTVYFRSIGDYEQAMAYNHKSLLIRKKVFPGGHYYEGNIYGNFSDTYMMMGDYENAILYLNKRIKNYEKTAPPALVEAFHCLGVTHLANKDYLNSQKACIQSIHLATEDAPWEKKEFIRQPTGKKKTEWHYFDLPAVYILLGATYRETGDLESAFFNIQKGMELAQKEWEKSGDVLADGYFELGKTWEKKGNTTQALKAYRQVFPILKKYAGPGDPKVTETYNQIGKLHAGLQMKDSASFYFQLALHSISPEFHSHQIHHNPGSEKLVASTLLLETLQLKTKALAALFEKSSQIRVLHDFVWVS